jgi:hypothetical protein
MKISWKLLQPDAHTGTKYIEKVLYDTYGCYTVASDLPLKSLSKESCRSQLAIGTKDEAKAPA